MRYELKVFYKYPYRKLFGMPDELKVMHLHKRRSVDVYLFDSKSTLKKVISLVVRHDYFDYYTVCVKECKK